ncbi:BlaI/MecI/CopY family transcriptional regulator [Gimesia sp.]|uniref:BlaI/MecI/CopY family transcriptional regulator n=1 Tax=Gimesia sp. TaxID=2024833 RepID=UPI003A90DB4B
MNQVSISDAEWQVMNVIWDGQPLAAQEIVSRLSEQTDWAPQTVKTMLHRLVKKEVLTFEQQGNRYVYRSRIKRSACVKQASRAFLDRVFDSEPGPLLAHFMQHTKLSAQDIAELRRILDEKER